jgi:cation transporter-like permease
VSATDPSAIAPETGPTRRETTRVRGEALVAQVKSLLHEGTVRRLIVKNDDGHTVMEIPVVAGVLAAVVAPFLTAVGAVAALSNNWKIEVERTAEQPDEKPVRNG